MTLHDRDPDRGHTAEQEAEWRAYLEGTHPAMARGRRWFRRLPHDPRCRMCLAPFRGLGSLIVRRFGFVPWEKNPTLCRRCVALMSGRTLGGAEVELTMLFADVRGSTALAEHISSSAFTTLMNRFYGVATDVLVGHLALIDKFVGDEVVALFLPGLTGPHASLAVQAAIEILRRTGHDDPAGPWLPLGVGVHTGIARVGMVGTPGGVVDFTALGDGMNTTARLASTAGPGELLVSDAAAAAAGLSTEGFERRTLELKGRSGRVDAFVLGVHVPGPGDAPTLRTGAP